MDYKNNKNLKFLRKKHDISQQKLAEDLSLTRNKIATYESGVSEPSINTLLKISAFFNISIDDFLKKDLANNTKTVAESNIIEKQLQDIQEGKILVESAQKLAIFRQQKIKNALSSLPLNPDYLHKQFNALVYEVNQLIEICQHIFDTYESNIIHNDKH